MKATDLSQEFCLPPASIRGWVEVNNLLIVLFFSYIYLLCNFLQTIWFLTDIASHKILFFFVGRLYLNSTSGTHSYFDSETAVEKEMLEKLVSLIIIKWRALSPQKLYCHLISSFFDWLGSFNPFLLTANGTDRHQLRQRWYMPRR